MHVSPGQLPSMHLSWTHAAVAAKKLRVRCKDPTCKLPSLLLVHWKEHVMHPLSYQRMS
jgi:hypothetical protein